MLLLDTTPVLLQKVFDIVKVDIVEAELKNVLANIDRATNVERLRTTLFQDALLEASKFLSQAMYITHMTEEDLYKLCAKEGLTVEQALHNFMVNTMHRDLESVPREKAVDLVLDAMEEYDKYKQGKSRFN